MTTVFVTAQCTNMSLTMLCTICPSVHLKHASIISKRLGILSNFFHHQVARHSSFSYQTLWQYSDGDPITGLRMQVGYEKIAISYFRSEMIQDRAIVTLEY